MLKSWFYTALTALATAAIAFVTNAILARALGPEGRGVLASILVIVTFSASIAQLGLGQATVYSARTDSGGAIKWLTFASLLVVGICTFFCATFGATNFEQIDGSLWIPSVVLAIGTSVSTYSTTVLQAEATLSRFNIARLTQPVLVFVLTVILSICGTLTLHSVVWVQISAAVMTACVTIYWLFNKDTPGEGSLPILISFRSHLYLGIKYHANSVLGLFLTNIDKLYFFLAGGLREFGIYAVAYGLSRLTGNFQEAISTVIFSRFAGRSSAGLADSTLRVFRLTFVPLLAVASLLSSIGPLIFRYIFGTDFVSAVIPYALLNFECVIAGASWILAQQFNASGRPELVFLRQLAAVVPVACILPFVPNINIAIWLAGLLLIAAIIRLVVTLHIFRRLYHTPWVQMLPSRRDVEEATQFLKTISVSKKNVE